MEGIVNLYLKKEKLKNMAQRTSRISFNNNDLRDIQTISAMANAKECYSK